MRAADRREGDGVSNAEGTVADVIANKAKWTTIVGDAREPVPQVHDGCVQTLVTSPPYFGLRDYGTASWDGGDAACEHKKYTDEQVKRAIATSTLWPNRDGKSGQSANSHQQEGYRSVCGRCGARRVDLQIGQEETPQDFVESIVTVMREAWRILADDGTLWLNLGDSYAANRSYQVASTKGGPKHSPAQGKSGAMRVPDGLKPKDLIAVPWRAALALQGFAVTPFSSFTVWADELSEARERGDWDAVSAVECKLRNVDLLARLSASGWYLRSDIVWGKLNPMPESVTDRPTRSHEFVFLLSKNQRYYYNADAIMEPVAASPKNGARIGTDRPRDYVSASLDFGSDTSASRRNATNAVGSKECRNSRDVWQFVSEPYAEAHFATMPPELARKCVLAGSRKGDIVYDPFGGAATTALVALQEGRRAIMRELNPEYVELQRKRLAPFDADASTPVVARNADFGPLFGGGR